ncbi:hypothetical protein [Jannaschia pohangensis]|nr:hypothetical protein [Jannaschia pohangensis]
MAVLLVAWRRFGLAIFLGSAPFGMLAAFNLPAVGGTTIIAIDLAVLAMLAVMLTLPRGLPMTLGVVAPGGPGVLLMAFLGLAAIATIFLPRVFAGDIEVFSIGRVANQIGIVSRPLQPGGGNLSQLLRMILSVFAFIALAAYALRRPDPGPILQAVKVMTAVHVGLGLADILTNAANVEWMMSIFRTANYSLTLGQQMAGLNRMIGGFPEASAYGYMSLGLFGFWMSYWTRTRSTGTGAGIWLAASTFVLLRGTSSSAYVGAVLFMSVFVAVRLARMHGGSLRPRTIVIVMSVLALLPLGAMVAFTLYQLVPAVTEFVDRSLLDKLSTTSGVERMSWNVQAMGNFLDTNLMGAGLGSVRASQWLIATLATTGLAGTAVFVWFLTRLFRLPHGHLPEATADLVVSLKFGCLAFLARALVTKATPNLEIAFFAFAGLAAGLCLAHAKLRASVRTVAEVASGIPAFRSARPPRTSG